jgi:hypothetical protein
MNSAWKRQTAANSALKITTGRNRANADGISVLSSASPEFPEAGLEPRRGPVL